MLRVCNVCEQALSLDRFYKSNLSTCMECVKARVRDYRQANLAKVQAYDRMRGLLPHRKEANKERAKRRGYKHISGYKDRHPDKRAVHIIVGNAIRDGKLIPQSCEWCGADERVQAHPEDYSKPLDVTWLCRACHGARHRQINEERRQGML